MMQFLRDFRKFVKKNYTITLIFFQKYGLYKIDT